MDAYQHEADNKETFLSESLTTEVSSWTHFRIGLKMATQIPIGFRWKHRSHSQMNDSSFWQEGNLIDLQWQKDNKCYYFSTFHQKHKKIVYPYDVYVGFWYALSEFSIQLRR